MENSEPPSNRQNVSFTFSKKVAKSFTGNKLDEIQHEKDFVTLVKDSEVQSYRPKERSQPLIIPLIKRNNWRIPNENNSHLSEDEKKIKDMAIQELLNEATEKNAEWENRDYSTMSIPLIMQNKIPEGYETDDHMDVSLRAEESKLEDYDKVPIEQYGLAMLRGMGWSEGEAIGNKNKGVTQPVQVQLRPKGLGLGADASVLKKSQKKAKEEKLELVKGAYVNIVQGPHKGFYGEVLGLDEENGRAIIKLSSDEKTITFPEFFFSLVSKKEFDKESRILNRASYEKYKLENNHQERNSDRRDKDRKEKERSSGRHRDRSYSSEEKISKHSKKSKHNREQSKERYVQKPKMWVRPQLKVRLIDDKYKKGKYFNQKLIVVDVFSSKVCSCKTDDDKYLEDVSPSMLETVIPRDDSSYVMIVQGKHSGELCTILQRDKSRCVATVQFLSDRDQALNIEYDSICEYVGDVSQFD